MRILLKMPFGRQWMDAVETLRQAFPQIILAPEGPQAPVRLKDADAVVTGALTKDEIRTAEKLKIIFVPYAGVDALPLAEIQKRGIRVSHVHANAPFVAERALAMVLAFYGKILPYHEDLKRSQWHGYWAGGGVRDTWQSIRKRTCAVIGAGEIGKAIARHLKPFDCPVIGFKKHPEKDPPEGFDTITLDLWEAIAPSEIIFVSLPLTPQTHGILNASMLKKMQGKFIVNVGRGELIDEKGFFEALKEGVLKGAAIDAWYAYPGVGKPMRPPSKYPFHELPNVNLSPHVAGVTPEAATLNIEGTLRNIREYLNTGRPASEVDPGALY